MHSNAIALKMILSKPRNEIIMLLYADKNIISRVGFCFRKEEK